MNINQQWLEEHIQRADGVGDLAARAALVQAVEQGGTIDPASEKYWRQLALITQYARTFGSNPALAKCLMMTHEQLEIMGSVEHPALIDIILVECGDDPMTLDPKRGDSATTYFTAHRGSYLGYWNGNLDVVNACIERLSVQEGSPNLLMAPLVFEIALSMAESLRKRPVNIPSLCQLARMSNDIHQGCRLINCAFPESFDHIGCTICQGGIGHD